MQCETADHELATYRNTLLERYACPLLLCDCCILYALVELMHGRVRADHERLLIVGNERCLGQRIGLGLKDGSRWVQRHVVFR